jgi:transcriptional regulator with XRE-family HTH domain
VVVAQAFPTRPSALPDVRDFVRRHLTSTAVSDEDVRILCDRVAGVLLDAAGTSGTIQVSLRIFPAAAEVDVLFAPDAGLPADRDAPGPAPDRGERVAPGVPAPPAARVDPPSFAAWLATRLRAEAMSMEAAARRLDVSTKTISRWVNGTTEPRLRDLYRIRAVFGEPPFHGPALSGEPPFHRSAGTFRTCPDLDLRSPKLSVRMIAQIHIGFSLVHIDGWCLTCLAYES